MRVWIVQPGEPLPTDPGTPRLWRSGILATMLRDRGHEVVWWASTFRHADHSFRSDHNEVRTWNGIALALVHSPGYTRNVSLARLRDHHLLGKGLAAAVESMPRPDVIHAGYPPLETCEAMVEYGHRHGVPVVIDVRDMWPEAFADVVPTWAKPFARPALVHYQRRAARMLRRATAIHGHTPRFRDYGLSRAKRPAGEFDQWFPFGYPDAPDDAEALARARTYWNEQGVNADDEWTTICFLGNLNTERPDIDHRTPGEAIRLLEERGIRVRLVYCGAGRVATRLAREFEDLPTRVLTPGYMDSARIWELMRRSQLGLLPYMPSRDFSSSLPNKSIEYLAGGLPVLTSLAPSYLYDRFSAAGCVVAYPAGQASELANTLEELARQPSRLRDLAANARRAFEDEYSARKVYGDLADLLERLVSAHSLPRNQQ